VKKEIAARAILLAIVKEVHYVDVPPFFSPIAATRKASSDAGRL
jgi:hypothetical protein